MTVRHTTRRRPLVLSNQLTMFLLLGLHVERRGNAWTTWEVDR